MLTNLINRVKGRYLSHPEAVIITCFFDPMNSPYRLKAFNTFYDSIKHLNHRVIECVIGDSKPKLAKNKNIQRIFTESLLWHKESLLNKIVTELDPKFKYVFWVDADVIFDNKAWLTESVKVLKRGAKILQPFEYCFHLKQDEEKVFPSEIYLETSYVDMLTRSRFEPKDRFTRCWRSFCANYAQQLSAAQSLSYDKHGHVGFAWGAQREVLEAVPLYDKALIGGADHIIAHAAAGQIPHKCITKSFTADLESVLFWSKEFFNVVRGKIGFVRGNLFHIWHGDIDKRQYLQRIQDFTAKAKTLSQRDSNGLFVNRDKEADDYMKKYFVKREVTKTTPKTQIRDTKGRFKKSNFRPHVSSIASSRPSTVVDDGFLNSMALGYMTDSPMLGTLLGGNPAGAIIGSSLNTHNESTTETHYRHEKEFHQTAPPADFIPPDFRFEQDGGSSKDADYGKGHSSSPEPHSSAVGSQDCSNFS